MESKDIKAQPKRGESYFYTVSNGWQDVCDLGYNNPRIKALTHSDAAPALVEPDDYDSYNGVSKADLITQYQELMPRYNQIFDNDLNYDPDYTTCLANFSAIYYTILDNSEAFNASEIYATSRNFEYMLDNVVYLKPENMLEDFSELAHRYLSADARYYPVEQQCYKDFLDEYNRIARMAENLEINGSNYYVLRDSLIYKLFDVQRYIGKYSVRGNTKFGDVNHDGMVDVLDATILQKYSADLIEQNFYIVNVGDLNEDGAANVLDAINIQQLCADKLDHFKVYDQTFGVEDGYTAETDKATITQYLRNAIEERSAWDTYFPSIFSQEEKIYKSVSYEIAKEALANAENLSPAILLYEARNLIDFVDTDI